VSRSTVKHRDASGPQPQRGARTIDGGVAAANDDDLVAECGRVGFGDEREKLDPGQREFVPFAPQRLRPLRADRDEHGAVFMA
jgi:hypothetical protein